MSSSAGLRNDFKVKKAHLFALMMFFNKGMKNLRIVRTKREMLAIRHKRSRISMRNLKNTIMNANHKACCIYSIHLQDTPLFAFEGYYRLAVIKIHFLLAILGNEISAMYDINLEKDSSGCYINIPYKTELKNCLEKGLILKKDITLGKLIHNYEPRLARLGFSFDFSAQQ